MSLKAADAQTGGALALLETDEAPGFGPPMHLHRDAAEAFYILEGDYRIFIQDREFTCPAGSFVFIPAGIAHGFRVGATGGRKLNIYTPAAMVGYFDELAEAIRTGGADPEALTEIARRHSMEVLGPVPEGYA